MNDFDRRLDRMNHQMTGMAITAGCMGLIWLIARIVLIVSISLALTKWAGVW